MDIRLSSTEVIKIEMVAHEANEDVSSFDLNYRTAYPPGQPMTFYIVFSLHTLQPDQYDLRLEFVAHFKTSEPTSDAFRASNFTDINAPAIAFPYLRSYVSNLTMLSGYEPLMLPTLNFAKLYEQKN